MTAALHVRRFVGLLAIAAALAPSADAFLELNEGRDRITGNAAYGIGYDSNLFARAGGAGDYDQTFSLGAEYVRRAGLIGVDASFGVTAGRFRRLTDEDYTNPSASLELTKTKGRLTGTARFSAARESRSDVAANIRADSWSYDAALDCRYPINERYYFTTASDFTLRDYVGHPGLFNLNSFSQGVDVFYTYSSKLDLLGGYRIRFGDAVGGSTTQDHALNLGASGSLLPKLNGSVRVGYQWRRESGGEQGRFGGLTSSVALGWPVNQRVTVNGAVSKDFMTTATDVSVDATAFSLSATLKPTAKLTLTGGAGYTLSRYLGVRGAGREDRAPSVNALLSLAVSRVISSSISYAYTDNQSDVALSDFGRHTVMFTLSARF